MRNKQNRLLNLIKISGLFALTASLTISCANKGRKTAGVGDNPYTSNPYYSGSGSGTSATPSSTGAATYEVPASAQYPASPPIAVEPPIEYPTYSGGAAATPAPAPAYTPAPAPAPQTYGTYSDPYATQALPPIPSPSPTAAPMAGSTSHTVMKGENLYRISLRYGTSVSAIQQANGLNGNTIHPGQVLRIP